MRLSLETLDIFYVHQHDFFIENKLHLDIILIQCHIIFQRT